MTTHSKIKNSTIRHKVIVFDEDPFTTLFLPMQTAYLSDIKRIMQGITNKLDINTLLNILELAIKAPLNTVVELPSFAFTDYEAIENAAIQNINIQGNILDFINCENFLLDPKDPSILHFIKKYLPQENKKYIILSATADEWIYRQLFGDRVEFYDMGHVEPKGIIVQDTTHSCSQQNLLKPEVLKYANENAEGRMIITFRNYTSKLKNTYKDIYFGNCQGKDNFKDKPLAIIGTPHVNPAIYILYAKNLGLDLRPEDYRMSMYRVQRNGMDFNFFTFENEILRNLQFYFIERELRQAVGRARLIRNLWQRVI